MTDCEAPECYQLHESKNSNQLICFLLHAACKFIMVGHFYANVLNTQRCRPSEMILVTNTILVIFA